VKARQSLGAQSPADAAAPYIVTLGGGPAKDGGAILLRFKLSDGREIAAALKVGSVGLLVDRISEYLWQALCVLFFNLLQDLSALYGKIMQ
jgi:hypothetical protein